MVLILFRRISVWPYAVTFPSPCGDYGSYLCIDVKDNKVCFYDFPSPCGDYGSYRTRYVGGTSTRLCFSVPLRGLWFLSIKNFCCMVFFPSRFPSPCGDYGSYLYSLYDNMYTIINVFRPLAGIMVLIEESGEDDDVLFEEFSVPLRGLWFLSRRHSRLYVAGTLQFSVPLRGLWFLSSNSSSSSKTSSKVFRPLAGIMVLIYIDSIFRMLKAEKFPSPCGDYGSYLCCRYEYM